MIVTNEFLELGRSSRGGWNQKQLRCLGYSCFVHGWRKNIIGKTLDDNTANEFIKLKDSHLNKTGFKTDVPLITQELTWEEQYNHPLWQKKRLAVFKRDSFMCHVCRNKNAQLHAHHLFYEGKYIWDVPNGAIITVCKKCHEKIHKRKL